jgi:hypothetical protein
MFLTDYLRSRRHISTAAIGAQQRNGVRPRNWKQTWLRAATVPQDNSRAEFSGNWLTYISANARKDARSASGYLERCLALSALLGTSTRDAVAREAAVFCAWFRRDRHLAEKWLAQVENAKIIQPLSQTRINVAIYSADSDFDSALKVWGEGLTYIEKLAATPARESLREGWVEWRREIEERRNSLATASAAK